jgi:hypothetical protein
MTVKMIPVNNFQGILEQERENTKNNIVVFLLVKPSDKSSSEIINHFNYMNFHSGDYCNIYLIGYSEYFTSDYNDRIKWQF